MKPEADVAWAKTPIAAPELLGRERCEHLKPADRTVLRRLSIGITNEKTKKTVKDAPAPASLAVRL